MMNFHISDEISSLWWIFICVMNFHLCDEFSSSWWIFIFVMKFYLMHYLTEEFFISVIKFHMKSKVSHYWWFQPPWRNFIIWMNLSFSSNWANKIKEESFNAFSHFKTLILLISLFHMKNYTSITNSSVFTCELIHQCCLL